MGVDPNHKGKIFMRTGKVFLLTFILLGGCGEQEAPAVADSPEFNPPYQAYLLVKGTPFDLMLDDMDGNGLPDINVIDHAGGYGQPFLQKVARDFGVGQKYTEVGFHPGDMLRWLAPGRPIYVLAAEGLNRILALEPATEGGARVVSELAERSPRYITRFEWPGWENSLAIAPFGADHVVLLKNYDPAKGSVSERVEISLRREGKTRSVRRSERISVADIDGDGVNELLFASPVSKEVMVVRAPVGNDGPKVAALPDIPLLGAPHQVLAMDLNKDRAIDLIVPDAVTPANLNIFLNDGHGAFAMGTPIAFPGGQGVRQIDAKYDKDGRLLILGAGYGGIALFRLSESAGMDPGVGVETLSLNTRYNEATNDLMLTDLDGDGWMDAVIARPIRDRHVWVVYGPLWDHFGEMVKNDFMLDKREE